MSQVVPLRLDKKTLENIDLLVKLGLFSSRNEALRELIKTGMRSLDKYIEVIEAVEKLLEEEEKGKLVIRLDGATRQLLLERDRFSEIH